MADRDADHLDLTRLEESDAGRFSPEHAHERDGLFKALVKTSTCRASLLGLVEKAIFYDHSSREQRIHPAMVCKATDSGLVVRWSAAIERRRWWWWLARPG